ncbi:hypothetical protein BX600DRAFT_466616 [Xylariales sp. PMI_506]|nr:hypothetical protein BX600DRAFT_466616 [Xylariales sp. PMI_506]
MEPHDDAARVALACEVCRKRKRKCDGIQPRCSWCINKNVECHYVFERPRKRKLDHNYAMDLEAQIALLKDEVRRLENLNPSAVRPAQVAEILAEVGNDDGGIQTGSHRAPLLPADSASTSDLDETNDSNAISDVSSLMWRLKVGDNGETTFIGPSGNFCFSADASEGTKLTQENLEEDQINLEHDLRPQHRRLGEKLLGLFIRYINPVHQFIDVETLVKIQGRILTPDLRLLRSSAIAAGSLYADALEDRMFGQAQASELEFRAMETSRSYPTISTAEALSIMCWRELSLGHENMGWMYNGMACSLALHLGLTVSSLKHLQANVAELDVPEVLQTRRLRVKALWSVVLIDRIATSLLGRHCMLPWRRVQAPSYLEVADRPVTIDEVVFDYHCRLWFIHDQYMDRIYSFEFNGLEDVERQRLLIEAREQLLSFRRHLDPRLHLKREDNESVVLFCHMSYHMSQILIHRPYLNEPPRSSAHRLSIRSMTAEAADIVRLIREYEKMETLDKAPPFMVHSVLTAAITLLLNATSTQPNLKTQSINRIRVCFNALEAMSSRWPSARNAINVLRELANRWKIIMALPMRYSAPLASEYQPGLHEGERSNDGQSHPFSFSTGGTGQNTYAGERTEAIESVSAWESINPTDFVDYGLLDLDLLTPAAWDNPTVHNYVDDAQD